MAKLTNFTLPINQTLTSRRAVSLLSLLAVQVLQELHGLSCHDDLLEDRFEEGHHGVLSAAGALLSSRTSTGSITQSLLAVHCLRHAVQGVGGVPEVPVVHRYVLVPNGHIQNIYRFVYYGIINYLLTANAFLRSRI